MTLTKRYVVLLMAGLIVVVTAATVQVWTHFQVIDLGYQIAKSTRQQRELLELNHRLQTEYTLLTHPDRITRYAAQQKFVPVASQQLVILPDIRNK